MSCQFFLGLPSFLFVLLRFKFKVCFAILQSSILITCPSHLNLFSLIRGAGVVICLERGADLHTAQLTPLPLTASCFSKIQMVLPFWYRLTRVVPDKGPLNGCVRYTNTLTYSLTIAAS